LDDLRNNVFRDSVALPKRVFGGGGRIALNDAGQTPNVHFCYFDTGSIPVVIGLSNLPAEPGAKKSPAHPGPSSGYIAYCEGGRFEGQRGRGAAFDSSGKKIKEFKGGSDVRHQANFIEAVRKQDRSILNAEVAVGNDSTGWCNLANVAFRAGNAFTYKAASAVDLDEWQTLIGEMDEHVKAHKISLDSDAIRLSPMLELDPETEQFVGEHAGTANPLLTRQYRKGYQVPSLA
jgi:hypothetical protein